MLDYLIFHHVNCDRVWKRHRVKKDKYKLVFTVKARSQHPLTYTKAATKFKIQSLNTVSDWWRCRDTILNSRKPVFHPRWPRLEEALHQEFINTRKLGKPVRIGWFRHTARKLYSEFYPDSKA